MYVPRLKKEALFMVAEVLKSQPVGITADETTDVRDHSTLNVIASVHGKPHLIVVVKLEACNHSVRR